MGWSRSVFWCCVGGTVVCIVIICVKEILYARRRTRQLGNPDPNTVCHNSIKTQGRR